MRMKLINKRGCEESMKKIVASLFFVIVIISVAMIALPEARSEEGKETEDSAFQKLSDLINGKYEVKTIPCKKIRTFQRLSDCISAVSRGSE